jgi:hypothetical protein
MTDSTQLVEEKGSFRDRQNQVFISGDRIYRGISQVALDNWKKLEAGNLFKKFSASHNLVPTKLVDPAQVAGANGWAALLEHERVPFLNYSYEWSFSMLKDAALLHLDLMEAALEENLILKDSSSYNIMFVGSRPVFIDIPSFEKYTPGMPWIGFRQFCQHFLYPLMLQSFKGISFRSWLRGSVEGITPEECNRLMSAKDRLRPGVFTLVYLQSKLVASMGSSRRSLIDETKDSDFGKEIILANVRKLRKLVKRLEWKITKTEWGDYAQNTSYDDSETQQKIAFVTRVANLRRRRLTWDIGANTGTYSRILSANSENVVSMDIDELAIERLYRKLRDEEKQHANMLPLVFDLSNPSPALGWRCSERKSLDERTKPELVLCLALIHHLVITYNIPVRNVMEWLASFKSELVIEMLTKEDDMVKKVLTNKVDQYDDFTIEYFEQAASKYFTVGEKLEVMAGKRFLYHLVPKDGAGEITTG